jgi:Rho-related BTB domain-containing protein 1/2
MFGIKIILVLQAVRCRLRTLSLCQGLFSDVRFKLDDGTVAAHKSMLMARCDVMRAMFAGDFRESAAKVVCIAYNSIF